ncbi:hypothetical protein DERP_012870 [Dermatophagoides pteronyssinus]|uniref:Ig-like domain-containing protein n=1 Tax=Dermatophagoides pteronyssinus TaxID=6956 RepID=A0ABQ8J1P2_DERPT|nr:hypothetical protein DERP_012870 [Dermatophagoides pteronyssinus]
MDSIFDLVFLPIYHYFHTHLDCQTLRIEKFNVPEAISNGSHAILYCDYNLENSELYSVKFYKDYIEFYRYLPKEEDYPKQSFNLDGIYLDLKKSNATHVILHHTDLNSDGLYGCEVSTEGPAFATRKNEKLMKIYVLPDETLTINGSCDYYRIDEYVNFECISGYGWPKLNLNWFINDLPAPKEFLINSKPTIDSNGLIQSKLGLNFQINPKYFQNDNSLRIRCQSSLMFLYELKTVEYLIDGSKQTKSLSRRRYTSAQINSKEMPIIIGIRDKYNVNDIVNLNCSTTILNAQLSWFINGKKVNNTYLTKYDKNPNNGESILNLRFQMEKKYFQTEEIELQCTVYYIKIIADFQEQIIIRTFNSEYLLSQSSSCSSSLILGYNYIYCLLFILLLSSFLCFV